MYAIVDIETTGGFAASNGITEIAIILHNGKEEEGRYATLVNPLRTIPRYITALTGIDDRMVAEAPLFKTIAPHIHELLRNRVFVAHNVNFDFSFIRHHLEECGYSLPVKKLCTVRLARKIMPGLPSYSLGNICRQLEITNNDRHRAMGDAAATAILFERLVNADHQQELTKMIRGKNAEQFLPPHLPVECLVNLPGQPGVYYFENQKKEVIYVGKAINLQKRVRSHFSNNDSSRRKQELLRQVYNIRFQTCYSELMSLILESHEIRKLWPVFNRSQKKYHHKYGLYRFHDNSGYLQLVIEKKKAYLPAIYTFDFIPEGQNYLRRMLGSASDELIASRLEESPESYNSKIEAAISEVEANLPTFLLLEKDPLQPESAAAYLVEKGRFWGMGCVGQDEELTPELAYWKEKLSPSPDNDYIRGLLYQCSGKKNFTRLDLV
ncbi:exonuclease domain-containing protein [Flavihumibacter petaseus]|uniref:Putative nuclease n=1 Tax=Flavihumibacter petaseus NBRC 106054 TaxID=1220578 RepID=A0A0E9N1S1_9BACT|nr:exonuclease domain-containing protein [Flavihumibacter petaseus]GAO43723.1 putative nuclease [Flavihumibacter petaseus NBRC 106054]